MYDLYPAFFDISGRKVIIVGAGQVAQRKVETLLRCGSRVLLISPKLTPKLQELINNRQIECYNRQYQNGDLKGAWLVIAASNSTKINQLVFKETLRRRIFCNVVDTPQLCTFQVPAVLKRDKLQLAVSTAGAGPILAKKIRDKLQERIPETYGEFLKQIATLRKQLRQKYPRSQTTRAKILNELIDNEILELLEKQKTEKLKTLWQHKLKKLRLEDYPASH